MCAFHEAGESVDAAFEFLREQTIMRGLLEELSQTEQEAAMDRLRDMLGSHASPSGIALNSAAWLIRARNPE